MRTRTAALGGLLLLLSLPLAAVSQAAPGPAPAGVAAGERVRADLAAVVSAIDLERGASLAYVGSLTAVNFIRGHAFICTVACDELPGWGGAFFIYSEVDGQATGELMAAPGPEGVEVLQGDALARYLERVRLDPAPLRATYLRWYAPRPPPAAR